MTKTNDSWVQDGDGICISIGMVFYTDVTRRDAEVHALNRVLRKFKIPTTPPGRSSLKDRVKAPVGKAIVELRRRFRGYTPPPSYF